MRAVLLDGHNTALRFDPAHPEPAIAGGEVLDVTACGVCHSDLHVVDGNFGASPPIILGHEITGVHEQLGPVMVYAPWGCRDCVECADGNEMICSNSTEAGLFVDGGYAERCLVPGTHCIGIPDGVDFETAACFPVCWVTAGHALYPVGGLVAGCS